MTKDHLSSLTLWCNKLLLVMQTTHGHTTKEKQSKANTANLHVCTSKEEIYSHANQTVKMMYDVLMIII